MKKLCTLTLGMFMVMCVKSQTYTLTTSNVTYVELTGATDITGGQLWDDEIWQVPIGFTAELFDSSFTTLNLNSNGFLFDTIGNAEVMIGMSRADLVDGAFLIDFNSPIPVTYLTEGTAGTKIFKVEWKLANVWGADSTNVINYQVWIYEETGNIEFHFGAGFLGNMSTLSVQKYSGTPYFEDGISLIGDPLNPQTSTVINQKMDNYPSDGMVYSFVKGEPGVPTQIDENKEINLSLYPNPVSELLNVNGKDLDGTQWNIINSQGQKIKTGILMKNNMSIPVNDLNHGYYLIRLITTDHQMVHKAFIK